MAKLILLNKPYKVLSQFTSEGTDKQTLADYIAIPSVYPAGRLDYDSEGLLLLTDNGILQNRIADPKYKSPKTYWVQVEGAPSEASLQRLRNGIELKDGVTKPALANLIQDPSTWDRIPAIRQRANIPTSWIELTISEGKNRQVRRMTAAIGHPTLRLIRCKIGEWEVGALKPGEYKEIEVSTPPKPRNPKNHSPYSKGRKLAKISPNKSR